MKIPKNYARVLVGVIKEGDFIKFIDGYAALAKGLIGCSAKSTQYTTYREKSMAPKEKNSILQKENAALKAELADIKAKWAKVEERVGALLEVM